MIDMLMRGEDFRAVLGMFFDKDRIDDAVLALLYLGRHDEWRTWKSFDWGRWIDFMRGA
jgi:hypothetical protein